MHKITFIGIDFATDAKNVGMALGYLNGNQGVIEEIGCGKKWEEVDQQVACWIDSAIDSAGTVLLALDAPLGWPAPLGRALIEHQAGDGLNIDTGQPSSYTTSDVVYEEYKKLANRLFGRETDRVIYEKLRKKPLEVGAQQIARTALAALLFLDRLRKTVGKPIKLAWVPDDIKGLAAIEVYPAATLESRGLSSKGYKNEEKKKREEIIQSIKKEIR